MTSGPPPVAVTLPCRVRLLRVKWMPVAVFVLRLPLRVTVPLAFTTVKDAASRACVLKSAQSVTVTAPTRAPLPMSPLAVMVPSPAFKVNGKAPSRNVKSMSPIPEPVSKEVIPKRVIGASKLMLSLTVVIVPLKATEPAPVSVNGPLREMAPAAVLVNAPPLDRVKVRGPPPVVVIEDPRTMLAVVIEIPSAPVVVTAPFKLVVPLPADWVIDTALRFVAVTSFAEEMVMAASGVTPPTAASNRMFPFPPINVKFLVPSRVL
jgi:hypothetical protein